MGKRGRGHGTLTPASRRSRREQAGAKTPRDGRRGRAAAGSQHPGVGRRGARRGRLQPVIDTRWPRKSSFLGQGPRAADTSGCWPGRPASKSCSSTRSRIWSMPFTRRGQYTVKLYGEPSQEVVVSGYRAYHSQERAAIAEEIRDAALVLTAVFDHNLRRRAQTLALGLSACARAGRNVPLNCIACENMMDSSTQLGQHVRRQLAGNELAWCEQYVGFPDCMISRVVPRPEPDPLADRRRGLQRMDRPGRSFPRPRPAALTALELVDNQTARLERKLFIHNGGHAICGYFGFHRGHQLHPRGRCRSGRGRCVLGALDELGEVVRRKWGFSRESIDEYKQDLCRRGACPKCATRSSASSATRSASSRRARRLAGSGQFGRRVRPAAPGSSRRSWRRHALPASARSAVRGAGRADSRKGWRTCWKTCAGSPPVRRWRPKSPTPQSSGAIEPRRGKSGGPVRCLP